MPRVISFIVLLAIVLLVGAVFFQVMAQFIVPLFLACVLLVVFQPLHRWMLERIPKRPRLAALITTVLILIVVLLPLVWLGLNAYTELYTLFPPSKTAAREMAATETAAAEANAEETAAPEDAVSSANENAPAQSKPADSSKSARKHNDQVHKIAYSLRDDLFRITKVYVEDANVDRLLATGSTMLATKALSGVQAALRVLVGLAIMMIALYYFLADGPAMIETVMDLSPLEARYEQELLERFGDVSRAVVVATLLSAVVQGALAGIGYYFALPASAPIFLLITITMATALVPFVGAAATWICVCAWVYLYGERIVNGQAVQGDPTTAILLAIYCTIVVSGIDNVIKPLILHGQSKLHPLLALLSILGGVQVLGPVGILVGPMLVSFLQALLNMLRKEIDSFSGPVVDEPQTLAESVVEVIQNVVDENAESAGERTAAAAKPTAAKKTPAGDKGGRRRERRKR